MKIKVLLSIFGLTMVIPTMIVSVNALDIKPAVGRDIDATLHRSILDVHKKIHKTVEKSDLLKQLVMQNKRALDIVNLAKQVAVEASHIASQASTNARSIARSKVMKWYNRERLDEIELAAVEFVEASKQVDRVLLDIVDAAKIVAEVEAKAVAAEEAKMEAEEKEVLVEARAGGPVVEMTAERKAVLSAIENGAGVVEKVVLAARKLVSIIREL